METETMRIMKGLTEEENKTEEVKHALQVRKSLAQGNYGRFFKLYRDAPHMGGYLMDVFIDKHRILCMQRMCMSYIASNISLGYMSNILAFENQSKLEAFLTGLGKI
jgi:hypothetical protein